MPTNINLSFSDEPQLTPFYPEMVFVQGGSFQMGSVDKKTEMPVHEVSVPDFYIGKYMITFEEYESFCLATGRERPAAYQSVRFRRGVNGVRWTEAQAYTEWLSQQLGACYRLPTEAEWEFAARGGIHSKGYIYAGSDDLGEVGWYEDVSWFSVEKFLNDQLEDPARVGQKKPNELGLYDMSGYLSEYCLDFWHNSFQGAPCDGSAWLEPPSAYRVQRNANHSAKAFSCRIASRYRCHPNEGGSNYGFRVVKEV